MPAGAPRIRRHVPRSLDSVPRAAIAPLLHESLGERVYRTVRDLILSQVFPPGSKLNVEQICRDLGVSRTPVWDTMRRLESEGLVNTVPRHGVFVLNYGDDQIRDLFAVRGRSRRSRSGRPRLTSIPTTRAGLEASMKEMEQAAAAGAIEQYSRAAIDFHDLHAGRGAEPGPEPPARERVRPDPGPSASGRSTCRERVESSVAEHRAALRGGGGGRRGSRRAPGPRPRRPRAAGRARVHASAEQDR